MKKTFNDKKKKEKKKKKKKKGEKEEVFEEKDYYFSFVKACRLKRVLIPHFKTAIASIRDDKPPAYFVALFKKGNMHVKPTDQGRAFIVDYLIKKGMVEQQEPEQIDLTFDDDVSPPSSLTVRPEREAPEESSVGAGAVADLPAVKRSRIDEEYAKHACSEPVIGYMRHIFMPYCDVLIRHNLIAKGVRLKDLLSPQEGITRMYHPPTCMYHPHVSPTHMYVSPVCITRSPVCIT